MTRRMTILGSTLLATTLATPLAAQPIGKAVDALRAAGFAGQVAVSDARKVLFDRTVGLAKAPERWIWGSVSKQVTAALVMAEVDRGTLSLDDAVATRLPGFRDAQGGRATLRQLLQHTSGLANPDTGVSNGVTSAFFLRTSRDVGGATDAMGFCAGPPAGQSGRFSYNNCDTIVAGAMLERATKRSFATLLAERITKPLGMRSTRLARPGEKLALGASQDSAAPINIAAYGPAGAIVGSARDLLRFDQALMNGTLMSADARDAMWKGEPSLGYAALGAWSFAAPLEGCRGPVKLVERRGSVDGVQTRNIIAPDLKLALVVFTPQADYDFGEIWQAKGTSYKLASAAFCPPAAPSAALQRPVIAHVQTSGIRARRRRPG